MGTSLRCANGQRCNLHQRFALPALRLRSFEHEQLFLFGRALDEHGEAEVQGESDRVDEAGAAAGAAAAEADKAEEEAPAAA